MANARTSQEKESAEHLSATDVSKVAIVGESQGFQLASGSLDTIESSKSYERASSRVCCRDTITIAVGLRATHNYVVKEKQRTKTILLCNVTNRRGDEPVEHCCVASIEANPEPIIRKRRMIWIQHHPLGPQHVDSLSVTSNVSRKKKLRRNPCTEVAEPDHTVIRTSSEFRVQVPKVRIPFTIGFPLGNVVPVVGGQPLVVGHADLNQK